MKRLLVFTENYARGGGNRYMIDLVNALANEFDGVIIASNRDGIYEEDAARLRKNALRRTVYFLTRAMASNALGRIPGPIRMALMLLLYLAEPLLFFGNVLMFILLLRAIRPVAVVCCNGGYPAARGALAMAVACGATKTPAVMSIVSTPMPRRVFPGFYERLMDSLVWRSLCGVIVNARAIEGALVRWRGMPAAFARVVHNGMEDKAAAGPGQRRAEGLTVGCVIRADRAKGVLHMLDAFMGLARKYNDLRFVIAGEGDASAEMRSRLDASDVSGRIEMTGYFSGDVHGLVSGFDIYVFPSLHEGFPYGVLEAMRAGCAIVSTAVGGIPEALRDGVDGLLIEPASAKAMEIAVERLIKDRRLAERLSMSARSRFKTDYTLAAMEARARKAFDELIPKEGRG